MLKPQIARWTIFFTLLFLHCSGGRSSETDSACTGCEEEVYQNRMRLLPTKYSHISDSNFNLRKGVLFYLYTRTNPEDPQQLYLNDAEGLSRSNFRANKPTKFMTHGWKNYYLGQNCQTVRRAFLLADDYNVVIVDWSSVSKLHYPNSVKRLNMVATYVAKFVEYLQRHGSNVKNMTLVGHSLGAQMMGLVAYNLKDKIGHVVALDPALPMYTDYEPGYGINQNDADLVEVIHSNSGHYGANRTLGHVDFWPNGGGPGQPGCENDHDCAHNRAYEFYAESMKSSGEKLIGRQCDNFKSFKLGKCADTPLRRFPSDKPDFSTPESKNYFLITRSDGEFGLGEEGTKPGVEILAKNITSE